MWLDKYYRRATYSQPKLLTLQWLHYTVGIVCMRWSPQHQPGENSYTSIRSVWSLAEFKIQENSRAWEAYKDHTILKASSLYIRDIILHSVSSIVIPTTSAYIKSSYPLIKQYCSFTCQKLRREPTYRFKEGIYIGSCKKYKQTKRILQCPTYLTN